MAEEGFPPIIMTILCMDDDTMEDAIAIHREGRGGGDAELWQNQRRPTTWQNQRRPTTSSSQAMWYTPFSPPTLPSLSNTLYHGRSLGVVAPSWALHMWSETLAMLSTRFAVNMYVGMGPRVLPMENTRCNEDRDDPAFRAKLYTLATQSNFKGF